MIDLSKNIFDYFASLYGNSAAEAYREFIQTGHNTHMRKKKNFPSEKLIKDLADYGIIVQSENSVAGSYKILKGSELTGKTIHHILGKYYIQSLSSMIPPLVLNPGENDSVLDLCAAPGSKSTQIADMMNNKGTLLSNEISIERVKMLIHNIDRMNFINIGVLNQKGELLSKIYQNYFDKILVDAPCSALGVLQKKQEVSNWWSEDRVAVISSIQIKLLISAIKMLKPGGELVYSTCTLTPEENELNIDLILRKYPVQVLDIELPLKSSEGFTSYRGEKLHYDLSKARRILPWEVNSEGFFVVKLRKTAATDSPGSSERFEHFKFIKYNHISIKDHLTEFSEIYGVERNLLDKYKFMYKGNDIFFTGDEWSDQNPGRFTRIGTRFGTITKNNKMQIHSYAAQYFADHIKESLYIIEDIHQLRNYLAGGIIRIQSGEMKTAKIIKYNNMVLGTAVPVHNGLKSQFPKSKRMQEIIF